MVLRKWKFTDFTIVTSRGQSTKDPFYDRLFHFPPVTGKTCWIGM
jgi:hypothetical protein